MFVSVRLISYVVVRFLRFWSEEETGRPAGSGAAWPFSGTLPLTPTAPPAARASVVTIVSSVEVCERDEKVREGVVLPAEEIGEAGGVFARGRHARMVARVSTASWNARIRVLARDP